MSVPVPPPPPAPPAMKKPPAGALIAGLVVVGVIVWALASQADKGSTMRPIDPSATVTHLGESPSDSASLPSPTPSPSPVPTSFSFTAPDIIGVKLGDARDALKVALADAPSNVRITMTVWNERESNKPKGTILEVRDPKNYEAGTPLSIDLPASGNVHAEIEVVVAKTPIQFHGDSIYIGGYGSAMVTWIDSSYNIHQQTFSLPAWFKPQGGVQNYNAQRQSGDNGEIVCELRYDDETYSRSRSSGPYAICSVSA
jgi:hypothetical protein